MIKKWSFLAASAVISVGIAGAANPKVLVSDTVNVADSEVMYVEVVDVEDDHSPAAVAEIEKIEEGLAFDVHNNPVVSGLAEKKWEVRTGGLGFGFNVPLGVTDGVDLRTSRSSEIQWLEVIGLNFTPVKGGLTYSIGVGFDWRNYGLGKEHRLNRTDKVVHVDNWPADVQKNRSSRIKVTSLTVPIMASVPLGKKVTVKAGPILNFNVHSSLKAKYELPDREITEYINEIKQKVVTVDLMASIMYKGTGLYLKYAPMRVLKDGYGPKFNSMSFGVILFY